MKDNENELSKKGDTFDSMYDMGNPDKLDAEECTNYAVDCEIYRKLDLGKDGNTETDVLSELERKDGLIERIKKYLGVDLNKLDRDDDREKRERSKILYFFYMFEHQYYPDTRVFRVLRLLDTPSMENSNDTFLNQKTHNGDIVGKVLEALGDELPIEEKEKIEKVIHDILSFWECIMYNLSLLLQFFHQFGFKDSSIELSSLQTSDFKSDRDNPEDEYEYPLERLYLSVCQKKVLGRVHDMILINRIKTPNDYNVPPKLLGEMESLLYKHVDITHAKDFIIENARRLSRYVYLDKKVTKDDVRRIRKRAEYFPNIFKFYQREFADDLVVWKETLMKMSNELFVVSFLQATILDDHSEKFNYTFYRYQHISTHMMSVNAAPRSKERVPEALQKYWICKINYRMLANQGENAVRIKMQEIELVCDEILGKILKQPTLSKMIIAHKYYSNLVDPSYFGALHQIFMVIRVRKFLQEFDYQYIDSDCKIRYAFLEPESSNITYNQIAQLIEGAIERKRQSAQMNGLFNWGKGYFYLELVFDHIEKTCALTCFDSFQAK